MDVAYKKIIIICIFCLSLSLLPNDAYSESFLIKSKSSNSNQRNINRSKPRAAYPGGVLVPLESTQNDRVHRNYRAAKKSKRQNQINKVKPLNYSGNSKYRDSKTALRKTAEEKQKEKEEFDRRTLRMAEVKAKAKARGEKKMAAYYEKKKQEEQASKRKNKVNSHLYRKKSSRNQ